MIRTSLGPAAGSCKRRSQYALLDIDWSTAPDDVTRTMMTVPYLHLLTDFSDELLMSVICRQLAQMFVSNWIYGSLITEPVVARPSRAINDANTMGHFIFR